jgi:outer membrane protein
MNKNLSIGLNVVLIIAVGVLYYLHFTQNCCKMSSSDSSVSDSTESAAIFIPESEIKQEGIVFVNTDSLLKNYAFYNAAKKSLEARQKKAENTLEGGYAAFQREAMEFQKKAQEGGYSQEEGARKEQELMAKQQQLVQNKEVQMGALMAEEQKLSEQLNKKVQEYVKKFCKDKNYQYVLGYTGMTSNILFKNDSLDITQPILRGLNEEYKKANAK